MTFSTTSIKAFGDNAMWLGMPSDTNFPNAFVKCQHVRNYAASTSLYHKIKSRRHETPHCEIEDVLNRGR